MGRRPSSICRNGHPKLAGQRCPECQKHYIRGYLHDKRRQRKLELVRLMGGKCANCGYNTNLVALDFDHIDPTTKTMNLGSNLHLPKAEYEIMAHCQLLCANCHRIKTYGYESDKGT